MMAIVLIHLRILAFASFVLTFWIRLYVTHQGPKRNFYKDLIVVIACLVVGVSCFLSLECVIKVTRKKLLEWSNILIPFFSMHIFCNYKLSSILTGDTRVEFVIYCVLC